MTKRSTLLNSIGKKISEFELNIEKEDIPIDELKEITIMLKELTDFRNVSAYKLLENSVMITFIGLLADCNEWTEIYDFSVTHEKWFSKFLDLNYGLPSLSTLKRHIAVIYSDELEYICVNYIIKKMTQLKNVLNIQETEKKREIISYDGKKCNGSKVVDGKNGEVIPTNAMSAYNVDKGICLATKFIGEKTNEIPTGPDLIKLLDLTNTISTFDALNTQKKTIAEIAGKGGDYVAALKGNQHNFFDDVKKAFEDEDFYNEAYNMSSSEEIERAHNQIEKRTYVMTNNISWLPIKDWDNLKSIGLCKKECIKNGKSTIEIRYYITSLDINEMFDFKRAIRDEWGIENDLHWHLDYTLKEDYNKTINKKAQANLNILRKLVLNILKLIQPLYDVSLKRIRKRIIMNFENEINVIFSYLTIEKFVELGFFE